MSKLLKEILKTALLPTAVLISGKAIGLYFALIFYKQSLAITHEHNQLYSVQILLADPAYTQRVNSLADILLLFLFIGVYLYIAIRYLVYVKASGNPRTVLKLARLNLLDWITNKNNALLKFTVWSIYGVLVGSVVLVNSISGVSNHLVGIVGLAFCVFVLVTLIRVFELESDKILPPQ